MTPISILIADDQPLIRDGLAAILSMESMYAVVGKTGDGEETVEQVRLLRPELVLMDIHMPKLDGLAATKQIKAELPDTKVIILTTFEEDEYIIEALRLGASGYLLKGTDTKVIMATVRDCLEGRMNYPFRIQQRLAEAIQSFARSGARTSHEQTELPVRLHDPRWESLSLQERTILKKLRQGKSNQIIASELYLTTGTIKNYLSEIYRKLNVSSRTEAVAYLHEHHL